MERPTILDYPDPIVTRYMERVRELSPAERTKIDGSWLRSFFVHTAHLAPLAACWALFTPLMCRAFVKAATSTKSPEAATVYRQFLRDLRQSGWRTRGRMWIASGLWAVRLRELDPEAAFRQYSMRMGTVITRPSLGWNDSPTA